MPTRKLPKEWSKFAAEYCRDPEHDPPSMQVFENGVYEHECPSCGAKSLFSVNKPTL